jgi:hypothetical protein
MPTRFITITMSEGSPRADISLGYDRRANKAITGFARWSWDTRRKCWTINRKQVPRAVEVFTEMGYEVRVINQESHSRRQPQTA